MHLEPLLQGLYKAAKDEEETVGKEVGKMVKVFLLEFNTIKFKHREEHVSRER